MCKERLVYSLRGVREKEDEEGKEAYTTQRWTGVLFSHLPFRWLTKAGVRRTFHRLNPRRVGFASGSLGYWRTVYHVPCVG